MNTGLSTEGSFLNRHTSQENRSWLGTALHALTLCLLALEGSPLGKKVIQHQLGKQHPVCSQGLQGKPPEDALWFPLERRHACAFHTPSQEIEKTHSTKPEMPGLSTAVQKSL